MKRYWFPKHYADVVQRLRVPSGFVLAAAFAWLAAPTRASLSVGVPVSVLGLLIRAWAAGHLEKNEQLAISGPYSHVRNPLYLGTAMVALGLVIAALQPLLALLFASMFLLVYLPAIELEEQHLRNLFPEYDRYAEKISMLRPRWRGIDSKHKFQLRLYFKNREYNAAAGFAAGVMFLMWRSGALSL
jgi:protein-S-isoprenylcysteine O-methyltransferase Ste14